MRTWPIAALLLVSSCGGRVSPLGANRPPDAGVSAAGDDASAASPMDAGSCSALPPGDIIVERLWEVAHSNYGLIGPGVFGIAPDGREVVLSGDEYRAALRHFAASDGALTSTDSVVALWRDRGWTIQGEGNAAVTVRALATGLPIATLNASGGSVPSGDGRRVITLSCQNNQMSFQTFAVPPGTLEASQAIAGACPSDNLVTTASGDAVLFSAEGSGELHRIDLATGAETTVRAHQDVSLSSAGDNLAIRLSPSERAVATVGRDAVLRLWSYPGLARISADIPTAWTKTYLNCYCHPRTFAPIAWSSDDALLATSDGNGKTVLRRGCDGAVVTTLPDPTPTMRSQFDGKMAWGPVFLAFGPRDQTLAVFYEGSLAMYRVSRR